MVGDDGRIGDFGSDFPSKGGEFRDELVFGFFLIPIEVVSVRARTGEKDGGVSLFDFGFFLLNDFDGDASGTNISVCHRRESEGLL